MQSAEKVLSAAIRINGKVIASEDHLSAWYEAERLGMVPKTESGEDSSMNHYCASCHDPITCEDGFITSEGRFISRELAFILARSNGQVKRFEVENTLLAEDLSLVIV